MPNLGFDVCAHTIDNTAMSFTIVECQTSMDFDKTDGIIHPAEPMAKFHSEYQPKFGYVIQVCFQLQFSFPAHLVFNVTPHTCSQKRSNCLHGVNANHFPFVYQPCNCLDFRI